MKSLKKALTPLSGLLGLLFLFQSCSVYHSRSVEADAAIEADRKLKLKSETGDVYKFRRLEKDTVGLYGIAGKRSKAAKDLSEDIVEENFRRNLVKIAIPENFIEEIRLRNKALSTVLTVSAVLLILMFLITDRGPGHPANLLEI